MKSYTNAFELITNDAQALENYALREGMMDAIIDIIKTKEWTQKEAAKKLGVTQPRISNLKNGRISQFSIDMLLGMLHKLGFSFKFAYTPKKNSDKIISMTVTTG